MISTSMVTAEGVPLSDVNAGDKVLSIREGTRTVEWADALVLGDPVSHACQWVETTFGARALVSNNALILIDDPARGDGAMLNVQSVGIHRVGVVRDGVLSWEHCTVTPLNNLSDVAQVLVPGGFLLAGESAFALLAFTIPR